MNRDFVEILAALLAAKAEFLVVGAYAVAVHGRPRATGDLDLWVNPAPANGPRVWSALSDFGAPLDKVRPADFQSSDLVFQIGVAPSRVDILTGISGVTFTREALMKNKAAAGRPRDIADLAELRAGDEDAAEDS